MQLRQLFAAVVVALPVAAQTPDTSRRAPGAIVSGALYDSLARAPLAGALVQLVDASNPARFGQTVFSDSLGRYTVGDVPVGRYRLGFFHPILDSLGVEPPLREVQVVGLTAVRADLAIPSPVRLRSAICGPQSTMDAGVVVGTVFDAKDHSPAAKVSVTGEWLELSFAPGGVVRKVPRLIATTGDNGWFALCNVPSGGTMALTASRGADSTDRIEVEIPVEGFLRRELYLGSVRVVTADTTKRADSLALPSRRVRMGDGRVSGTVVAAAGGQPLAGAQASIVDGPQTRANERGEFTLTDAPLGTRMLEVRAVGYYPVRRRVDVVTGAAPVHVTLSTLKAVLDTVKVMATRREGRDIKGFQERSRSGAGRYLTADDIMKRHPIVSSDVFRNIAGIRMLIDAETGERTIVMRGGVQSAGGLNQCAPAIFLNGSFLSESLTAGDIDTWVRPNEIAAIEIYNDVGVPAQFQRAMSGCGAIVIWSK